MLSRVGPMTAHTHPQSSHLQQQNRQTKKAMIIIPPITAKQIISVWKFTVNTHMITMNTTKTPLKHTPSKTAKGETVNAQ